jgi:hypothetical protein
LTTLFVSPVTRSAVDIDRDAEGDEDYEGDDQEGDDEELEGDDVDVDDGEGDEPDDDNNHDVVATPPVPSSAPAKRAKREAVIPSARGALDVISPTTIDATTPSLPPTTQPTIAPTESSPATTTAAATTTTTTTTTDEEKKAPAASSMETKDNSSRGSTTELGVTLFDMASSMDHHQFKDKPDGTGRRTPGIAVRIPGKVLTLMSRELKTLSTADLPGIYIRGAQDRIDLLQFAIIGAAGTPYFQGIFTFDLGVPNDYPSSPPLCHYHAYGYRLNPNLYVDGKVCCKLSLIHFFPPYYCISHHYLIN